MSQYNIIVIAFLCYVTTITVCNSLPVTNSKQELDVLNIPLSNGKELDVLTLGDESEINERNKRTIGILRDLFPEISKLTGGENSLDLNAINQQLEETIRVARQTNLNENALANSINSEAVNDVPNTTKDQEVSESKAPAIDELTLDSLDDADGDDRNKRQGLFGGGAAAGGNAGSGNFLFDIIRLFSGSVQTQGGDQRNNAASDSDSDSDEDGEPKPDANATGYSEGIPGPVTRLVVLANRGLANLIQDLILRVAATSERLVNFKARLITALI